MHAAEWCGQGRVIDDEENALRWQTPLPLICRTVLSVAVCITTLAPYNSFSCCPLSICWWRSLPLKTWRVLLAPLLKLIQANWCVSPGQQRDLIAALTIFYIKASLTRCCTASQEIKLVFLLSTSFGACCDLKPRTC